MTKKAPLLQTAAHWWAYILWLALRGGLNLLPYRLRLRTGGWLWRQILLRILNARLRVTRNMERIYPNWSATQQKRIMHAFLSETGRFMVEQADMRRFAQQDFQLIGQGVTAFEAAMTSNQPVLLVGGHLGNWFAPRMALKQRGIEVGFVYRPMNNPFIERVYQNNLAAAGTPLFAKKQGAGRQMTSHLASGGVALILIDQKQSGAPVLRFLGHPAETVLTPARAARATGAILIPVRSLRAENGHDFNIELAAPQPLLETDEDTMQALNDTLSRWIAERPQDWIWNHRRWR